MQPGDLVRAKPGGTVLILAGALQLVVLVSVAGCGPKSMENVSQPTALCGPPSKLRFHGVHAVAMAHPFVTPEEASTIFDGCAIISFGLDVSGKISAPTMEIERPAGSRVGLIAITVLASRQTFRLSIIPKLSSYRPEMPAKEAGRRSSIESALYKLPAQKP